MNLRVVTVEGTCAIVRESDSPELFEAFRAWQRTSPRSLKEVAAWDEVLEVATAYMEDDGTPEAVDCVEVAR